MGGGILRLAPGLGFLSAVLYATVLVGLIALLSFEQPKLAATTENNRTLESSFNI
jgi:hypothetical protein